MGLDLASIAQAVVPAPNGGKVRFAGELGIYGNAVVIDHGFGLASLCAHLSSIAVRAGERVAKGEPIGRSGATGLAAGDHLHLGVFIQGTPVDPAEWLDPEWVARHVSARLALDAAPGPRPAVASGAGSDRAKRGDRSAGAR